jgi:anti-anti-sigma factor
LPPPAIRNPKSEKSFLPALRLESDIDDRGWEMLRQETVSQFETILVVIGALAGEAVEEFDRKMTELCAGRFTLITLDLSQVPSMNSAAIGKLLSFRKRLLDQQKSLRIHGLSDGLRKLLHVLKLDELFDITK